MIAWLGCKIVISGDILAVDEVTTATVAVQLILSRVFRTTKETGPFVTIAQISIDAIEFPLIKTEQELIEDLNAVIAAHDGISIRIVPTAPVNARLERRQ